MPTIKHLSTIGTYEDVMQELNIKEYVLKNGCQILDLHRDNDRGTFRVLAYTGGAEPFVVWTGYIASEDEGTNKITCENGYYYVRLTSAVKDSDY